MACFFGYAIIKTVSTAVSTAQKAASTSSTSTSTKSTSTSSSSCASKYSCVCNTTTYNYTCSYCDVETDAACSQSNTSGTCSCNAICYQQGQHSGTCIGGDYKCYTCYNTCYTGDGEPSCGCRNASYSSSTTSSQSCTCNSTCFSQGSPCTCNGICYQEPRACTCHTVCYGYQGCTTCDGCNGYVPCSCDGTCYTENCNQCHRTEYFQPW